MVPRCRKQFYMVFPLILLLLRKAAPRVTLQLLGAFVFCSFAFSIWCMGRHPGVGFYLLPARAWELGLGAMLAIWHAERKPVGRVTAALETNVLPLVGSSLLAISIFGLTSHMSFPGWIALLPTLGAISLIASKNNLFAAGLVSPVPVFVGRMSYSWYLWHWPLLSLARLSSSGSLSSKSTAAIMVLSFVLAVLSRKFVEIPFRRSHRPPYHLLPRYAAALFIVEIPVIVIVVAHGWPQRFDQSVSDIEGLAQKRQAKPCLIDYGMTRLNTDSRCRMRGVLSDDVALLGV
jgi:peptidoglycan/LPS O-acetylase OafA/YrhL